MNEQIKIAHLGFIQGVINRMGTNSFAAKGWSIVIVAALLAVLGNAQSDIFFWFSLIAIFSFWVQDAFFVRQEHLFRKLYYAVAQGNTHIAIPSFSMETKRFNVCSTFCFMFSKTVWRFHLILLVAVVLLNCVRPNA